MHFFRALPYYANSINQLNPFNRNYSGSHSSNPVNESNERQHSATNPIFGQPFGNTSGGDIDRTLSRAPALSVTKHMMKYVLLIKHIQLFVFYFVGKKH